jgi:multidrug efflux pump subunit AcrA (membrane-fusion protein)
MPSPSIDTPQALDAAIAAARQARRERLLRRARNQRVLTRVALGLSGCIVIGALVAFFLARDREAATILAMLACMFVTFTIISGQAGRKKVIESLREMDQTS